jgi:hypothetical protein
MKTQHSKITILLFAIVKKWNQAQSVEVALTDMATDMLSNMIATSHTWKSTT